MIARKLFPAFAVAACVIAASGLGGCSSNSDFARFRNPFEGDLDQVGEEIAVRRAAFAKKFGGSDEAAEPGLAGAYAELEEFDDRQWDEDKEVTIAEVKRMRKSTGAICYPCNGKGYDFKRSSTGGAMVACEVCGGTGRR